MDEKDPESWYTMADVAEGEKLPHNPGGMVEIYQTQSLWNNRQWPRVHAAFAQIWGTEDLWVSNDRASMKPPTRADKPDWDNDGFIHWDSNPAEGKVKFAVQARGCTIVGPSSMPHALANAVLCDHRRIHESCIYRVAPNCGPILGL